MKWLPVTTIVSTTASGIDRRPARAGPGSSRSGSGRCRRRTPSPRGGSGPRRPGSRTATRSASRCRCPESTRSVSSMPSPASTRRRRRELPVDEERDRGRNQEAVAEAAEAVSRAVVEPEEEHAGEHEVADEVEDVHRLARGPAPEERALERLLPREVARRARACRPCVRWPSRPASSGSMNMRAARTPSQHQRRSRSA